MYNTNWICLDSVRNGLISDARPKCRAGRMVHRKRETIIYTNECFLPFKGPTNYSFQSRPSTFCVTRWDSWSPPLSKYNVLEPRHRLFYIFQEEVRRCFVGGQDVIHCFPSSLSDTWVIFVSEISVFKCEQVSSDFGSRGISTLRRS